MKYGFEQVCKNLPELRYTDMQSFATGVSLELFERDDPETVDKVVTAMLTTAAYHLEAESEED